MRARTSCPAGQGGVGGVSRARTTNNTAEMAAAAPKIIWTFEMLMVSINMGGRTIPSAVPTRLESVTMPTAVARSSMENQLAGTLVQAFNRKGWAAAIPMVAASTSV